MPNNPDVAPYARDGHGALFLVPKAGGSLSHTSTMYRGTPVNWSPNTAFHAVMEFVEGTVFMVKDTATGTEYPMFPSDVSRYIQLDLIKAKQITGNWQVVKRNTAYGIQLV